MAARAGIEPVLGFLQASVHAAASEIGKSADAHIGAQKIMSLRDIIKAWPNLRPELRIAVLAVTTGGIERQLYP